MILFPRKAEPHHTEEQHDRAWAHSILDLHKSGEVFERDTINNALRITGDLLPAGNPVVPVEGPVLEEA